MLLASDAAVAAARYRSFVDATLQKRIPAILGALEAELEGGAKASIAGIGKVVALDAPMVMNLAGWPYPGWEDLPAKVNGLRPRQAAFFDFEFWMYFRILTAVGLPRGGADPFRRVKHRDLDRHLAWADEALRRTTTLAEGLRLSLDANAHDLSQLTFPAFAHDLGRDRLDLDGSGFSRLNIIADNFGGEFVADLVLAIVAADAGIEVVVHVKQLPIFVSDTTVDDVTILLDRLSADTGFGRRLTAAVSDGRVRFAVDPFWASPQFFDRLPVAQLGQGPRVLNVLKGDLNFRRAIGDVFVPTETPFQDLSVLPAVPMLSLRSIKSYCVAGMDNWPAGLSRTEFPMDGSIVAVQPIPSRSTASAGSS